MVNAPDYTTVDKVRSALKSLYREDSESNLHATLLRAFADDLKPVDQNGRWRPSPLGILLLILGCVVVGIFVFFSFGASR